MKRDIMMVLMGKQVTVTHELRRVYSDKRSVRYCDDGRPTTDDEYDFESVEWKVSWESQKRDWPRAGWITGFRFLAFGTRKDNGEGAYLEEEGRICSLLVAYSPTTRPVRVPLDGYFHGGEPNPTKAKRDGAPPPSLGCTAEEQAAVDRYNATVYPEIPW